MSSQETGLLQLHTEVQASLSSQGGKDAVGLFLSINDLLQNLYIQGLDVDLICNVFISHDSRRVGIDQNNFHSLFLQGTACLCTCVVEFRGLADHNRTGTDTNYSFLH